MLNSTLLSSSVFNFSADPHNITWHDATTGEEMTDQSGRVLVRGETLWFLNVTKEDAGIYMTVVRCVWSLWGPSCFHGSRLELLFFNQNANVVLQTVHQAGGGPTQRGVRKAEEGQPAAYKRSQRQALLPSEGLHHQTGRLRRQVLPHVVQGELRESREAALKRGGRRKTETSRPFLKDCEVVRDQEGRYTYVGTKLHIKSVTSEDSGLYTCTLTFTLNGVAGSVSETIEAWVTGTNPRERPATHLKVDDATGDQVSRFDFLPACTHKSKSWKCTWKCTWKRSWSLMLPWRCPFRRVLADASSARASQRDHQGRAGWVSEVCSYRAEKLRRLKTKTKLSGNHIRPARFFASVKWEEGLVKHRGATANLNFLKEARLKQRGRPTGMFAFSRWPGPSRPQLSISRVFRVQFHQDVQGVCAMHWLAPCRRGLDRQQGLRVQRPALQPHLHRRAAVRTLVRSPLLQRVLLRNFTFPC